MPSDIIIQLEITIAFYMANNLANAINYITVMMINLFAFLPTADGTGLGPKLTSLLYRCARPEEEINREVIQMPSPCVSASLGTMSKVSRRLPPSPLSPPLLLPARKGSSLAFAVLKV